MKIFSAWKELSALQWELNNCRQTVFFLEESLYHTKKEIAQTDPRTDSLDSLERKIHEKEKQLRVIEDMLHHQKVMHRNDNDSKINLFKKAINNRIIEHKQELNQTKEYYYDLIRDLKVA